MEWGGWMLFCDVYLVVMVCLNFVFGLGLEVLVLLFLFVVRKVGSVLGFDLFGLSRMG